MRIRHRIAATDHPSGGWFLRTLAFLVVALPTGCDSPFDDDGLTSPEFIYLCVDHQADYSCVEPEYYDYITYLGAGVVLESVALGSQINFVYGIKESASERGYYYSPPEEVAQVVSAYTARLSAGPPFTALAPGLAPLVAVNGEGRAVDYMYVSVESPTELRLFPDGQPASGGVSDISLAEGESAVLRGRVLNGATYLRGTPIYECHLGDGTTEPTVSPVDVDCTVPGVIAITAVSEGTTTLRVGTGGVTQELPVTVLPGVDTGGPDAGGEDAGTDSEVADGGMGDDGGEDSTETDPLYGTDTALLDAGVVEDTDTFGVVDGGTDMDGGQDGGDASEDNDAG